MNTHLDTYRYRRMTRAAILLVLLGTMMALAPLGSVAQTTGPAPTSGSIVVDSYNCDTGRLNFHVPVTNLPRVDNPDLLEEPLVYGFVAYYSQGPSISAAPNTANPTAAEAPYTGNVFLALTAPPTNERDTSTPGAISTVDLIVHVGYGGASSPTDTSTITFAPDCGGSTDDLVRQLVAELIRILESILNG